MSYELWVMSYGLRVVSREPVVLIKKHPGSLDLGRASSTQQKLLLNAADGVHIVYIPSIVIGIARRRSTLTYIMRISFLVH